MTAKRTEPYPDMTQEYLKMLISYDPATGSMVRLTDRNGRGGIAKAGSKAGTIDRKGYVMVSINKKKHAGHRLAWLWMTGDWPHANVDHINRVKSDNRWANLRSATREQNSANVVWRSGPNGLPIGAYLNKSAKGLNRFYSQIGSGKNYKYLGAFDTVEAAHQAYMDEARRRHQDFHPQ